MTARSETEMVAGRDWLAALRRYFAFTASDLGVRTSAALHDLANWNDG